MLFCVIFICVLNLGGYDIGGMLSTDRMCLCLCSCHPIFQVFLEQLSSENLVDVTLSCQGQFVKAHKMILSACSPYFQASLLHKEHHMPTVVRPHFRGRELAEMFVRNYLVAEVAYVFAVLSLYIGYICSCCS
jgi:BTB/POZ domain.